jgi:hypothetical protein
MEWHIDPSVATVNVRSHPCMKPRGFVLVKRNGRLQHRNLAIDGKTAFALEEMPGHDFIK